MADTQEHTLVQVWHEDRWLDYTRATFEQARAFIASKPAGEFRAVDWLYKERVTIPARCPARGFYYSGVHLEKSPRSQDAPVLYCGTCLGTGTVDK